MNKAIPKNLIPVWVDHNNKFQKLKDYYVHEDTGIVYSCKWGKKFAKLKPNTVRNIKNNYPSQILFDMVVFNNLYNYGKNLDIHRILKTSYIFHYNTLIEELIKVYSHIPAKDIKALPRSIQEEIYRGLRVHHINHNKTDFKIKNLGLTTAQGNTTAYNKHRKKSL